MNIKSKNTQEVMKKEWLYAVGLVCLVSACTGTPQSSADDELCSIDVAGAMEKPAELKLSELGSDVRYVPLETTDSCLVCGSPNILLLDKEIVVFSRQTCFVFDKAVSYTHLDVYKRQIHRLIRIIKFWFMWIP